MQLPVNLLVGLLDISVTKVVCSQYTNGFFVAPVSRADLVS